MKFAVTGSAPTRRLDQQRFSDAQCEALFAAVLVHDDIHEHAQLPDVIDLDYSQEQLQQCYEICHQIWRDGVDQATLALIIKTIHTESGLTPELQTKFKDIRAKFKHLRFAFATCDERHRPPRLFHWVIAVMGYLQDATRNHQRAAVKKATFALTILLHKAPFAVMKRSLERFQPCSPQSFRHHLTQGIAVIERYLLMPGVTGHEFHEVRKIISKWVALYDNLKILYPSPYHDSVSQYLSTINGMMGQMHDGMVAKKFGKARDYHSATSAIPDEIRTRLLTLVTRFRHHPQTK